MAAPREPGSAPIERRQQILAATHRVTLARGLHDLRVADVAAELGVSTGLIHYHFATRDELLGEMLRETRRPGDRRGDAGRLERSTTRPSSSTRRSRPTSPRPPRPVLGAVDRRVG